MIVVRREDISRDASVATANPMDDFHAADSERDENGMTRDDIFDQLADEERVMTGGRGSRLPVTDSDGGTGPSGYSAGISSGSGSD